MRSWAQMRGHRLHRFHGLGALQPDNFIRIHASLGHRLHGGLFSFCQLASVVAWLLFTVVMTQVVTILVGILKSEGAVPLDEQPETWLNVLLRHVRILWLPVSVGTADASKRGRRMARMTLPVHNRQWATQKLERLRRCLQTISFGQDGFTLGSELDFVRAPVGPS